jgi:hypothetical protein
MSIQNILLGDGSERKFDRLNLDLMSLTVLAFPHGNSKGEESVCEDGRRLDFAGGILVEPVMRLPRFPVAMPLRFVHSCSANRFPHSVSKTLYLSQLGTIASVHCWLPGSGKAVSNDEWKLMSDSAEVDSNNCWALEGRDAMLAITFSTPGTWTVVR